MRLLLMFSLLVIGVSAKFNAYFSFAVDYADSGIEFQRAAYDVRKYDYRLPLEFDDLVYSEGFFMAEEDSDFAASLDERLNATFTEVLDGLCAHSPADFAISFSTFTLRTPDQYIVKLKVIPVSTFMNILDSAQEINGFDADVNHTGEIVLSKFKIPSNYTTNMVHSTIRLKGVSLMFCKQPSPNCSSVIHSATIPRDCPSPTVPAPTTSLTDSLSHPIFFPIRRPRPSVSSSSRASFTTVPSSINSPPYPNGIPTIHPSNVAQSSAPVPSTSDYSYPQDLPTAPPYSFVQTTESDYMPYTSGLPTAHPSQMVQYPGPHYKFTPLFWIVVLLAAAVILLLLLLIIVIAAYCRHVKRTEPVVKKACGIHPNPL